MTNHPDYHCTELITPLKGDIVCTLWQHLGRKSFIQLVPGEDRWKSDGKRGTLDRNADVGVMALAFGDKGHVHLAPIKKRFFNSLVKKTECLKSHTN